MDRIFLHFYPELRDLESAYHFDSSNLKILVLGGSVVNEESYCRLSEHLPDFIDQKVSVYSLARNGHTSLDSRIKYELLNELYFDYVFIYHAINDSRANNIPEKYFKQDYSHFAYYRVLNILRQHPEKKYSVLPFTFHFLASQLVNSILQPPQVPPFYTVYKGEVLDAAYWEYGASVKSKESFKSNLESVVSLAKKRQQRVILMSYAYYHPANYSLEAFTDNSLDYNEQEWPTEIYGQPDNVVQAIEAHNAAARQLALSHQLPWIDFNQKVPKSAEYFHDVCHLTEAGCLMMAEILASIINEQQ